MTVCFTGILLCATNQAMLVTFLNFSGNLSASRPNCFDNQFFQKSLVYFSFVCIKYFYCNIYPVSKSITQLDIYQGMGSSSIVLPGYVLILELLVSHYLFIPVLPQALYLEPPLEVFQVTFFILSPQALQLASDYNSI